MDNSSSLLSLLPYPVASAAAVWFLWGHLLKSGAYEQMAAAASNPVTATGIGILDRLLSRQTIMLSDKGGFHPSTPNFMPGLLSSLASTSILPYVERARASAPGPISYPLSVGIASQLIGGGIAQPWYWLAFIASGATRTQPIESAGSQISQLDAEANLLGLLIGYVIPGVALSLNKGQSNFLTLYFYFYPLTISAVRVAWYSLRRGSAAPNDPKTAYRLTMATYAVTMAYATTLHLIVLLPRVTHPDQLKALFATSPTVPDPKTTTIATGAFEFMHWDAVFIFIPAVAATLKFARTKSEAFWITLWDIFGVVAGGTGMALSGVWMWRERRLQREREALFVKKE